MTIVPCLISTPDGSDYNFIAPRVLTFDRDTFSFSIPIKIIDNLVNELREQFFGDLVTSDEGVIIDPQQTRVRIADNDGMLQLQSVTE